jgi:hypothetical protein
MSTFGGTAYVNMFLLLESNVFIAFHGYNIGFT